MDRLMRFVKASFILGAVFSASLALSGCAGPSVIVQHAEGGYRGDVLKNQTLILNVSNDVSVQEFRRTFDSRFGTGENYAKEIFNEISGFLQDMQGLAIVAYDSAQGGGEGSNPTNQKYALNITDVTVANSLQYHSGTPMVTAGGGMMMTGGGNSESCIITLDAELVRLSDSLSLWKVNCQGKAGVFLFAFETALMDATYKCVKNLCDFIRTGEPN